MADSENTRTLPERRLSRRHLLLSAAAIPTIPVLLQERPAMLDDTELLAPAEQVESLVAYHREARAAAHAAYEAADAQATAEGLSPLMSCSCCPGHVWCQRRRDRVEELREFVRLRRQIRSLDRSDQ